MVVVEVRVVVVVVVVALVVVVVVVVVVVGHVLHITGHFVRNCGSVEQLSGPTLEQPSGSFCLTPAHRTEHVPTSGFSVGHRPVMVSYGMHTFVG